MLDNKHLECLKQILSLISELDLFVVGGAVRELLLEKLSWSDAKIIVPDIDLLTRADFSIGLVKLEKNLNCSAKKHDQFLTAKIEFGQGISFDIVQTRAETYSKSGTLPLVRAGDFLEDALRRDFSINSMRIKLADYIRIIEEDLSLEQIKLVLHDQVHGFSDLQNKLIRTLHGRSFYDDPTRIFRALRYKARLNGSLSPETEKLMIQALQEDYLQNISDYRVLNEVIKILAEPKLKQIVEDLIKFKIIDKTAQIGLDYLTLEKLINKRALLKSSAYLTREEVLELIADSLDVERVESIFIAMQLGKGQRRQLLERK